MKRVAFITGANGQLGKSFYEEAVRRYGENIDVLLLQRNRLEYPVRPQDRAIQADAITDAEKIVSEMKSVDAREYGEAYFIHAIGAFETEGHLARHNITKEQLREKMEASNVKTFDNTLRPFLGRIGKRIPLHIIGFGSTSERYASTYWNSFLESKKHLQMKMRELALRFPNLYCLFAKLSSVDTGNENKLRPNADKSMWLACAEVAFMCLEKTDAQREWDKYAELSIFRQNPENLRETESLDAMRERWRKEMKPRTSGGLGKIQRDVPVWAIEPLAYRGKIEGIDTKSSRDELKKALKKLADKELKRERKFR
ncbi:MAG: hypothetical protein AAB899_04755 [Patescibacteria group bacterium]